MYIIARRNDGHIYAANAADRAAFERTSSTLNSPNPAFRLAEILLETDDWPTARDRLETERAKAARPCERGGGSARVEAAQAAPPA